MKGQHLKCHFILTLERRKTYGGLTNYKPYLDLGLHQRVEIEPGKTPGILFWKYEPQTSLAVEGNK